MAKYLQDNPSVIETYLAKHLNLGHIQDQIIRDQLVRETTEKIRGQLARMTPLVTEYTHEAQSQSLRTNSQPEVGGSMEENTFAGEYPIDIDYGPEMD